MKFEYFDRGGRYICLDQNPLLGFLRAGRLFMRYVGVRSALRIVLHRLAARPASGRTVTLPVFGNACLRVQRGFMVFDLERALATRVFRPQVTPRHFRAQHEAFRMAGHLSFAPTVRAVCHKEQWFAMDYVEGDSGFALLATDDASFLDTFSALIMPCLEELSASQSWETSALGAYAQGLCRRLDRFQLKGWPHVQRRLREFTRRTRAQLPASEPVRLGFTHGDFVHPNLVLTADGVRAVDWECAGPRSITHDLYTFYFSQRFWRDGVSGEALGAAERAFVDGLGACAPDLSTGTYRRLYYLERLAMVLGREFGPPEAEHIDRSITLFEEFERTSQSEPKQSSCA